MEAFGDWRFIAINLWPVLTAVIAFMISALLRRREEEDRYSSHHWYHQYTQPKAVTVLEAAGISLACFLVSILIWNGFRDSLLVRTEQINGVITKKDTSLSTWNESYDCNCTTDSKGNRHCSTCHRMHYYKHFFLYNSTGDWWSGNKQEFTVEYNQPFEPAGPDCWQQAYIGMPVSLDHQYDNYIAADGTSPFIPPVKPYESYRALIPPAPFQPLADPTRTWRKDMKDKVITIGFTDPNLEAWNLAPNPVPENAADIFVDSRQMTGVPLYLDTLNGFLGPLFQSDLYLIFINNQPIEIIEATQAFWQRGPKNAIYVFIFGTYDSGRFIANNARVEFGVPSNYDMQTGLQSRLLDYISASKGQIDRERLLGLVADQIIQPVDQGGFNRKEMRNYAALKQGIHPNAGQLWFSFILVVILDLVGKVLAYNFDVRDLRE